MVLKFIKELLQKMQERKKSFIMSNVKIDEELKGKDIYRIMPLDRFLQMLYSGHNILVHPSVWDDPYEKMLSESKWIYNDTITKFDEKLWYGQSWTLNKSDETMWRAYTNNTKTRAVKIKTTVDKISNMLKDGVNYNKTVTYYLRKIHYCNDNNLDFIDSVCQNFSEEIGPIVKTLNLENEEEKAINKSLEIVGLCILTTKRDSFEHEDEVRLLAYNTKKSKEDTYTLKVKLTNFIEEVELDPWAPKELVQPIREIIFGKLNKNISVFRSKLYDPPTIAPQLNISIQSTQS